MHPSVLLTISNSSDTREQCTGNLPTTTSFLQLLGLFPHSWVVLADKVRAQIHSLLFKQKYIYYNTRQHLATQMRKAIAIVKRTMAQHISSGWTHPSAEFTVLFIGRIQKKLHFLGRWEHEEVIHSKKVHMNRMIWYHCGLMFANVKT